MSFVFGLRGCLACAGRRSDDSLEAVLVVHLLHAAATAGMGGEVGMMQDAFESLYYLTTRYLPCMLGLLCLHADA